ncbi:MoaD/ThiS family protein [Desulfosporosinus sp.]|uniref:MoaD/ThiS family protein n=1 Tax=Desulfosporosinus sp. TaxID=157907 RepID=UPI000E8F2521|nr:MoaD/ThiS family protein [Desulfosporosinus sp.]MBC2723450.1 MoaD/ThiS family protein [Desulfosporosinus sp.]MBC2727780.1 MoaD/ThiS family protein [Desulfosporosinus sp.]HBV88937.1 hypothetical protein [Desulfosporosinus sp.]
MIRVNGREIVYEKGMTVIDALRAAEESADGLTLVIVNEKLLPYGQPYTETLEDGSHIKLFPIVSGG